MFAGFSDGDSLGRMQVMTSANIYRINVGFAQHLVEVQINGIDARFPCVLLCERFNDVAYRCELHPIGMLQVSGHMSIGDASGANKTDFQWFGYVPQLPYVFNLRVRIITDCVADTIPVQDIDPLHSRLHDAAVPTKGGHSAGREATV